MATQVRNIIKDEKIVNFKELEVPRRPIPSAIAIEAGLAITSAVVCDQPRSFIKETLYLLMVYGFKQEIQSRFSDNDQDILCVLAVLIMHPEKQDVRKEATLVADFMKLMKIIFYQREMS
ncbi:hypothetical protein LOD99_8769 [Oopsacas minuta]|uniref:Uncharacterized protein n=1 Tax=Oopsacas minuta TaxID=111878 RepID=A0AAV7JFC6_9METZ|nr:hypothetical protein LOD99_8769 [Oopsacas minuta]